MLIASGVMLSSVVESDELSGYPELEDVRRRKD
jgi:hypothetical protein